MKKRVWLCNAGTRLTGFDDDLCHLFILDVYMLIDITPLVLMGEVKNQLEKARKRDLANFRKRTLPGDAFP
jgi:hypothetical protein